MNFFLSLLGSEMHPEGVYSTEKDVCSFMSYVKPGVGFWFILHGDLAIHNRALQSSLSELTYQLKGS